MKVNLIVVIGFVLLAFLLVCLVVIVLISVASGDAGIGSSYEISGKPAFFSPVAFLFVLLPILVVAIWALIVSIGKKRPKSK